MIVRYSKENHDDHPVYERFGEATIDRANEFIDYISKRIAVMPQGRTCEYVEIGSLSNENICFLFADFTDGIRMWFRSDAPKNPVIVSWFDDTSKCPWKK